MSRHKRLERRIQDKLKSLVGGHEEDQGKHFMKYEFQDAAGERKTPRERLDEDLEGVFGEVELEICVNPKSLFSSLSCYFLSFSSIRTPSYPLVFPLFP